MRKTGTIFGTPSNRDHGTYTFTVEVVDKKTMTKPRTQDVATKVLAIAVS